MPHIRGVEHLLHLDRVDVDPGAFLIVRPRVGEHQPHVVAEGRHGLVLVRVDALAYVRERDGRGDDAVVVWVFALVRWLAEEIASFAAVFVGAVHDRLVALIECLFHALFDSRWQFKILDFPPFLHDCQEKRFVIGDKLTYHVTILLFIIHHRGGDGHRVVIHSPLPLAVHGLEVPLSHSGFTLASTTTTTFRYGCTSTGFKFGPPSCLPEPSLLGELLDIFAFFQRLMRSIDVSGS